MRAYGQIEVLHFQVPSTCNQAHTTALPRLRVFEYRRDTGETYLAGRIYVLLLYGCLAF